MKSPLRDLFRPPLIYVLALSLLVGLPPFVIYASARIKGDLPSEQAWSLRGGNHGPWWGGTAMELLIMLSMLALLGMPLLTAIVASIGCPTNRRTYRALSAFALCAFQWALLYLLIARVFWTID